MSQIIGEIFVKQNCISAADKQDVGCPDVASVVEIRHYLRTKSALADNNSVE
ncbi:hypothetical protein SNE25_09025 [Mucilaginibacter sabulilitoris]|uniref:Uncharacterized protein n=1 Tax=Mucilaginibacter sabulilitoris TaxID=1173583 RepID=A0ABZ0TV43_9SPHI|nr:hypothetical protein [Mucilaginibacter sabulilitoris]WPU95659.1 hypothetical protein SNE25_09025 [Mucilaginibacter sabulilitoris]